MTFLEPSNLTTIPSMLTYVQGVTNDYFGFGIVISLYFTILLVLVSRYESVTDSLIIAGWSSIIISGFSFFLLGLLTNYQFFLLVITYTITLLIGYWYRSA